MSIKRIEKADIGLFDIEEGKYKCEENYWLLV
jgi:hypothetical protein